MDRGDLKGIIGVMVEFKEDDNPLTSGNGKFINSLDIGFIDDNDILRCTKQILDPPPHNTGYFLSQLKAVKNYYYSISDGEIDLQIDMVENPLNDTGFYTAVDNQGEEQEMEFFAYSENDLTKLYKNTIQLAQTEIIEKINLYNWNNEDFIIVVFHAGLGQDLGAPLFDPTIYDIHSAYVDEVMISNIGLNGGFIIESGENQYTITNGILMPETLNEIFFDVIEDLHPITYVNDEDLEDIYCNYQLGMTGLFSYFLGYRLGFPVMHSTDNIDPVTRIGKFGLMDYGAYNGRGMIPVPPDAWSRIYKDFTDVQDITSDVFLDSEISFSVSTYSEGGDIYKVSARDDEYFLIENRSNIIKNNNVLNDSDEYTIDEVVYLLNCDSENDNGCNSSIQLELKNLLFPDNIDDTKFYWLDIVTKIFSCSDEDLDCEFIDDNGVIINFPDYDYGLPGSGLLIWHIQEPSESSILSGMNNDLYNKAIHLEEADGMINIGFDDPSPFGSPLPYGWFNDFWFDNNSYYEEVNNSDDMIFNYSSIPSSNTYSDLSSNISIDINPGLNDNINVTVSFDSDKIGIIDEDFTRYLGNNGQGIYYLADSDTIWYSDLNNDRIAMIDNDFCSGDDCLGCKNLIDFNSENDEILVYNDIICIADKLCSMDILGTLINCPSNSDDMQVHIATFQLGYFVEEQLMNDNFGQSLYGEAVGDIDLDGLDEIIVSGQAYDIIVASPGSATLDGHSWGTMVSGFSSSFDGGQRDYLISDLLGNNPDFPEIISFPSDSLVSSTIDIIDYNGNIIEQFPASNFNAIPCIISNSDMNTTFIVHGNRTIRFDKYNSFGHYWHNIHGTTYQSNSVGVSRQIHFDNYQNWQDATEIENFDFNQAFNYPNPFQDNTVFKFYISEINSLTIKIYSIAGFLVDEIQLDGLINHQFNEYSYNTADLYPGLYIAELKSDNHTEIIKLLKTK
tara:strand:- start:14357 stop:17227 length:2871 start_codon:yes stop_codon:yes gene_type:complete